MSEPVDQENEKKRWLTVIGLGEDGIAGLGDEAKTLIATADFVFGGKRHIELCDGLIAGKAESWLSPIALSVDRILSLAGENVVVLASGDPFLFGMGATLVRSIDAGQMRVIPYPSSFSLAASRLGWPLQDVAFVSLHGRPLDLIRPYLQPGCRIIALTSDASGPRQLAGLLTATGFGSSRLTVLEALGGPRERLTSSLAETFALENLSDLNVCAIEVVAGVEARIIPLSSGIDDAMFEHDGQITKREIRAVTLSALSPRRGELLWDIGGGSGSVSIEWMLRDPHMRAIVIEADPLRAERISRNAANFGVPGLVVVTGKAPDALAGLKVPDAIFIGGGGSDAGVLDQALNALKPGGRLVANAVTLEMEEVVTASYRKHGGELCRIDISRLGAIGSMKGWRPAMPVTQWVWTKPHKEEIEK